MNPVHTLPPYFPKIQANIICPSVSWSQGRQYALKLVEWGNDYVFCQQLMEIPSW
jgi:hypothetical protein